jgi:hypothetical protein
VRDRTWPILAGSVRSSVPIRGFFTTNCVIIFATVAEVFVSYRREDWPFASKVCEGLASAFGEANIFRDTESLHSGDLYLEAIEKQLDLCRVTLVVISERLLQSENEVGPDGRGDFFHLEISLALKRTPRICVIPLLVGGTRVPDQKKLPPDLAGLFARHWQEITDRHFRDDINDLIRELASRGVGAVKRTVSYITAGCLVGVSFMVPVFAHDVGDYVFSAIVVVVALSFIVLLIKRMRWHWA